MRAAPHLCAAPPYKFKPSSSSVGGRSLRAGAAYALITAFDSQLPSIYRKKCPFRNFNGPSFFSFFCYSSKVTIYQSRGEPFLWNRIWDLGWFWVSWGLICNDFAAAPLHQWMKFIAAVVATMCAKMHWMMGQRRQRRQKILGQDTFWCRIWLFWWYNVPTTMVQRFPYNPMHFFAHCCNNWCNGAAAKEAEEVSLIEVPKWALLMVNLR